MTQRERFLAVMEYRPVDRVPNYEVGAWPQTRERWAREGMEIDKISWDWFTGSPELDMDPREFIQINSGMLPGFEPEVLERGERYEVIRNSKGVVTRALRDGSIGGSRMSMDQYLSFPVETAADFEALKRRYNPSDSTRLPAFWREFQLEGWKKREHPLIFGQNCSTLGYYWRMREWMGTENLSFAFYDEPDLVRDMCAFITDFTIELMRPVLDEVAPDYIFINEDMAMKSGPLLSPACYREFIFPEMKRLVDFIKGKGVNYVMVDSDGNTEPLIPLLLDAGVDGIWPIERASVDQDPAFLREKYSRALRLWGAVDKREIAKGKAHIDAHLRSLIPMIEAGGFIPTFDHTVPPDVSYADFMYYMEKKRCLLNFEFGKI